MALDYSHLGGAPSFGDAITSSGDMLLAAIKMRQARQAHEATIAQQQAALQRQSYKDNQDLQLKRDALAETHNKNDLEARRYQEGRDTQGTDAIFKSYREGGIPAAEATAGAYGLPMSVEHAGEDPGAPPQAPQDVQRPEDLPFTGNWPPEVRAMLAASHAKAQATPASKPPAGTEGAVGPDEPRPEGGTQPPPANADAVDQELYKSHAQGLAEWEQAHKERQAAQAKLNAYDEQRMAGPNPAAIASQQGYQEQGQRELEAAQAKAAFPMQMREFDARSQAYQGSAHPVVTVGDRKVSLPSQGQLDQPNEEAAQKFLAANLPTAKDPAQIAAIKRTAAYIRSGALKPTEAGKTVESTVATQGKQTEAEKQAALYRLTAEEQVRQKELDRASRERAAANSGQRGQASVDVKKLTQYESTAQHALGNTLAKVNVKELQEANRGLAMINNPNGVQGQLALDTLAKNAMGGRGTNLVIQRAWNAIPVAERLKNQLILQTEGHHSPEVLAIFRKTLADQVSAANAQAAPTLDAINQSIGLRSQYAQDPGMLPYVKGKMREAYSSMGQPIPPELQDDEGQVPAPKGKPKTKADILKEIGDL